MSHVNTGVVSANMDITRRISDRSMTCLNTGVATALDVTRRISDGSHLNRTLSSASRVTLESPSFDRIKFCLSNSPTRSVRLHRDGRRKRDSDEELAAENQPAAAPL